MDRRRRIGGVVRVVGTVAMLAVLVTRVHVGSLVPDWDAGHAGLLLGAVGFTLFGTVLAALRWQRVLAALEVRAKVPRLLNTYLACLFISNFLPTTIGGDVLRVTRMSAETGEAPRTVASVVLERLTGWLVLPLITLAALALNPALLHLPHGARAVRFALGVAGLTLAGLGLTLAAVGHPRLGGRLTSTSGWRRFTGAIHLGVDRFRRHPAVAAEVLIAGVGYQLAIIAAAFLAARAVGVEVGWTALMAFMPVVAIVQVLPFPTVGGLGLREGALVVFLAPLGVAESRAIALGLVVYAVNLVASLLGAPAFAAGRRRPAPAVTV